MQVDDKYQYSCENKDSHVHGWISNDPRVGFWVITPSDEFRAGGPVKPDLASHTGPVSLSVRKHIWWILPYILVEMATFDDVLDNSWILLVNVDAKWWSRTDFL